MTVATPYRAMRAARAGNKNMPTRANMAAWWRYHVAITQTTGKVTRWEDQSGNARHLLQANSSIAPSMLADGSVLFDGVAQYMQATFTLAQPCTIYMAFQQVTWTTNDILFDGSTGTTKVTQVTGSPALALNGGAALANDSTIPVATQAVMACVFNSTSSVYQVGAGGPTVTTTGDGGTNTPGGFTLGASRTPGNYGNILVREAAIFTIAHDADTRLKMLRYFGRVGNVGGV